MNNKNMTALVSSFLKCYNFKNSNIKIYSDKFSAKKLTESEYNDIFDNMSNGIKFFNPEFVGQKNNQWSGL